MLFLSGCLSQKEEVRRMDQILIQNTLNVDKTVIFEIVYVMPEFILPRVVYFKSQNIVDSTKVLNSKIIECLDSYDLISKEAFISSEHSFLIHVKDFEEAFFENEIHRSGYCVDLSEQLCEIKSEGRLCFSFNDNGLTGILELSASENNKLE